MSTKDEKTNCILNFQWIYGPERNIDLILAEKAGLRLYKMEDDKITLKEVKYIQMLISWCWYEPIN